MKSNIKAQFSCTIRDVLIMLGFFIAATLVCRILRTFDDGNVSISMVYLLAVLLTSRFTNGYLIGIVSAFAGVLCVNYLFIFPIFVLNITMTGYPTMFISMLVVSIITSTMTTQIKQQETLKIAAEKEKMRSDLLRAISHDLRTPLTSIVGMSDMLIENEQNFSSDERVEIHKEIREDASWLIRMVENLLSVTRIQDDTKALNKVPEAAEEIISHAVLRLKKYYPNAEISVSVPQQILFVPMDCVLIEQVLINLMENSIRHGKSSSKIKVDVRFEDGWARFTVADSGAGFKKETLDKINEGKFIATSQNQDNNRNMGIGLSVCSSIVKAHGGKMKAENGSAGGAVVSFYLPIDKEENNE